MSLAYDLSHVIWHVHSIGKRRLDHFPSGMRRPARTILVVSGRHTAQPAIRLIIVTLLDMSSCIRPQYRQSLRQLKGVFNPPEHAILIQFV